MQSEHTIDKPAIAEAPTAAPSDIVEARLWQQEHEWLYGVLKSEGNVCPTFRFPDLISAAVTLCLGEHNEHVHVFRFLGSKLVLRAPSTARRRESMWRLQYEQLQALQKLPANRHPNPNFQLDQITTACVALAREMDESGSRLLIQARLNMAKRSSIGSAQQI